MSYPIGLDEYPTAKLREELENRELALAVGRCGYCGQLGPIRAGSPSATLRPPVLKDKHEAWIRSIENTPREM